MHRIALMTCLLSGACASDVAPRVSILSPESGETMGTDEPVELVGQGLGPEAPEGGLDGIALSWYSYRDGWLGFGRELSVELTAGDHRIELTGTDPDGRFDLDAIDLVVAAAGAPNTPPDDPTTPLPDDPPQVAISAPEDGADLVYDGYDTGLGLWYLDVILVGSGTDDVDGPLDGSALVWTTDRTDLQNGELGTGSSVDVRLYGTDCFGEDHVLTLTATDAAGQAATASIRVRVYTLC